jgi:hypothetical protein
MANTFTRHPIDHSDLNVWGPKNTAVLESVTGVCTAYLYVSANVLYVSTGKIGIVDTPSGTNGIGVVDISAAESIAHGATTGNWKRVYMTVSAGTASFAVADLAGETDENVLPDSWFSATYIPIKGGYYTTNNARDIGIVWVDGSGNPGYVLTDRKTFLSASGIYAFDADGLVITDEGGNMGICVENGGNVGIKTRNPGEDFDINGNQYLSTTTSNRSLKVGQGATTNIVPFIDLIGDTTYSTYGLRLQRGAGGANSNTLFKNRGTGTWTFTNEDAGDILFETSSANRFLIDATTDSIGIGGYSGASNRDCWFYYATDTYSFWDESESDLFFYIAGAYELVIATDSIGIGGAAGGVDRDCYFYFSTDSYHFWDESANELYLYLVNSAQYMFKTNQFGIGGAAGGADRDCQMDYATDSYIYWDEVPGQFLFNVTGANEFLITTNAVGIGGYTGKATTDCSFYWDTDAYRLWDENPGQFIDYVEGAAEFKITSNDSGIGGYAGGSNRDSKFYLATDAFMGWAEAASELNFQIAGALELKITTDAVGIGGYAGGSNRNCHLYFATDAFIQWVEASDYFTTGKDFRFLSNILVAGAGTYDIGTSTAYWNEINAKDFTDRAAIWIENPDEAYQTIKNATNEEENGYCALVEKRGQKRLKYSKFPHYCWDKAEKIYDEDVIFNESDKIDSVSFESQNRKKPKFKNKQKIIKKGEKTRYRVTEEIEILKDGTEKKYKSIGIASEGFKLSAGISVLFGAVQKCIEKIEFLESKLN